MLVIGLIMISPASRNNSAQAIAQTVGPGAHFEASAANAATAAW